MLSIKNRIAMENIFGRWCCLISRNFIFHSLKQCSTFKILCNINQMISIKDYKVFLPNNVGITVRLIRKLHHIPINVITEMLAMPG